MWADQFWRLVSILGQFFVTILLSIIALGILAFWRRSVLLKRAQSVILARGKASGEVLQGSEVIACEGAPTPLQALCTPGGTQFVAFSTYEAHVLLHEMYHGSTDSRLQDSGFDSLSSGQKPYIVDVSAAQFRRQRKRWARPDLYRLVRILDCFLCG